MSGTTSNTSLLTTFEQLDDNKKLALAEVSSTLDLSLATLKVAKENANVDALTAEHIEACLEFAGVSKKRESIRKSLSRAGERVKSFKVGPDTFYKIMTKGLLQVRDLLERGNISLVRIESNTPRTAKRTLEEILATALGDVSICDPYYGINSLDVLEKLGKERSVRFLTKRASESGRRLNAAIRDFRREFPNIQLRTAAAEARIHDRYILSSSGICIVGHGLKDIGGSDSFVISLDATYAADVMTDTQARFDSLWSAATAI